VIGGFIEDSVAKAGGIKVGDKLLKLNGTDINVGDNPVEIANERELTEAVYTVERDGEQMDFKLTLDKSGMIGVILSPEIKLSALGMDFYAEEVLSSVTEIQKVKKPFYIAPVSALNTGVKISYLTASAFLRTLGDITVSLKVSDDVGGPIQVAGMSYSFVKEGGFALLNFIALISLTLAVINIIPIPALDGGRLFFIVIEAFRGKPVDPKIEGLIHTLGFMFLMAIILVVTFYDIIRF
jgi:regulator of sigma E protease